MSAVSTWQVVRAAEGGGGGASGGAGGGEEDEGQVVVSKLTFVDLAGSERLKKTGAEGTRRREGIQVSQGGWEERRMKARGGAGGGGRGKWRGRKCGRVERAR